MPVWSGAFAFGPDGKQFVTLNLTNRLAPPSLWDTASLREVEALSFLGASNRVVAWSPDGRLLALGDYSGILRIWDWPARRLLTNFVFEGALIGVVQFAAGGRTLWCGLTSKTPPYGRHGRIWNVADWHQIRIPADATRPAMWMALSPDNRTLAVLDEEGTVAWWDLASGRRQGYFPRHFASVDGKVAFSPDGLTLAGSAREGLVTLWDVAARKILATMRSNVRFTYGVAFSPDGQRLICGGADPTEVVRLMDLRSRRFVASLPGEPDQFWFLQMSPDGNTLAAAGMYGTTLLWRAPSRAEIEAAEKRTAVP
jgi:WD40 repeat protein